MATAWKKEINHLGVDTDIAIAKRLGVSKESVRQKRAALGIERAPRRLDRPERSVGASDVIKCLNTVPLAASDRQLLTDCRVSHGWSQTELAARIDSSLAYIHAIESGKKSPSPEYLSRVCQALGLQWECEFHLRIVPKKPHPSRRSRG